MKSVKRIGSKSARFLPVLNSPMSLNFYEILNVDRGSTPEEIKQSYQRLILIHHPDKKKYSTADSLDFSELQKAWETLRSPELRKLYDADLFNSTKLEYPVHDTVPLTELVHTEGAYSYPCRCGDYFSLPEELIDDGYDLLQCPSCSLVIRIQLEPTD